MRYLLTIALLWAATLAFSQSLSLTDFNQARLERQKTALLVLGGWAVANMGTGLALRGKAEGSDRYFHEMNMGWGAINLAIAGFGYWSSAKADPGSYDLLATINEQHKLQKILLFNAGLDVGYMLGGAYLIERAKNTSVKPERLRGFGQSIMLQGGFLFAFDLVTYYLHARHNGDLSPLLEGLSLNGTGLSWQLNF
ncbi:MAG: hypothetical protein D6772_07600 [Bacteroidetes bacterium]|nr:MAG: hypothetical protein D6772_07600 [Bacteroidota bacterium]